MQMTELLYIWSRLDVRVTPLVRAVRHWAEKVGSSLVALLVILSDRFQTVRRSNNHPMSHNFLGTFVVYFFNV